MSGAPSSSELRLIATPEDAGQRIDVYLSTRLGGYSRSQTQRLIREGQVKADGKLIKGSLIVTAGMTIDVVVPPPLPDTPVPEALPLSILHDDDDLVVVDKPSGMVVHPAPGHATGTLVNALLHHVRGLSGIGGRSRPGIVHRLDRGTSGVMVVAKHDRAHQSLSKQFQDRTVRKVYVALVWGRPEVGRTFDTAIGRDPNDRQKISSRARRSRSALTTVNDVEVLNGVSLVHVTIGSGRTHQIRVHLSEAGYPIVGDVLYGGDRKRYPGALSGIARLERPFLHASQLAFAHPADGRTVSFESPLPRELEVVVDALRRTAASRLRPSVGSALAQSADDDSEGDPQ